MAVDLDTAHLRRKIIQVLQERYHKTGANAVPWRSLMLELGASEEELLAALRLSDEGPGQGAIIFLDADHISLGRRWTQRSLRYRLNRKIRQLNSSILRRLVRQSPVTGFDLHKEAIHRILLVRASFRMGNTVLTAPGISMFHKEFPNAKIDFVGSTLARSLFRNLPIDQHITITRRFPNASWTYPSIMRQIRSTGYDLAVDLSCSQSALGAFIVGFSGARFRVGLEGEWGRWFNVRIPRPQPVNKYQSLPAFMQALGIEQNVPFPPLRVPSAELQEGKSTIDRLTHYPGRPIVGVFVGARQTGAKRWPAEDFCKVITELHRQGINVVTFVGPEESDLISFFKRRLNGTSVVVSEPSLSKFTGLISNCDLFVSCDSGPMHLACSLGIPVVAIFQKANFGRWGPPSSIARIVYERGGCSAEEVIKACQFKLASGTRRSYAGTAG